MKFTIAQIGANRLEKVLLYEKGQDPKQIINALKSDITGLLSSYLDDFEVEITAGQTEDSVCFNINVIAKRVKSFGTLPY
ncbi:MAG: hypothetical protein IJA69_04190 [Clostridia bacterium]|nr:hypothetical protein [Clostridia bacterium]